VKKVAIIGAGLGGLSAAARLAAAGFEVDIYEQQNSIGGKAGTLSKGGFRFDTGPSLLTMPYVFDQLFEETGEKREDFLSFIPLHPVCNYFFSDGTILSSYSSIEKFAAEIAENTDDSEEAFFKYFRKAEVVHEITAELFLWKSLHEKSTYMSRSFVKALPGLSRISALRSLHSLNARYFSDPRMIQLFNRYATYNGSNPYRIPGTFSIIPFIEYNFGGFAVKNGIHAVPQGVFQLAEKKGAQFFLNTKVDKILTEGNRVRGIRFGGNDREYDIVVSNVDVQQTYSRLLNREDAKWYKRYSRMEMSSSGMVFMWGMDRRFLQLDVHNIFFSSDYPKEFNEIFDKRICPTEPTVYINITSKVTPGDAPKEGENWFILVNVPNNHGQDWEAEKTAMKRRILKKLEIFLGKDLEKHISVESALTPADIERDTGSTKGSLYGISSNSMLSAFRRHPNRNPEYKGLYVCGGSVHPGGGMPLVILSGKITADLVKKYE